MKNIIITFISAIILTSCSDDKSGMSIIFTGDVLLDRGVADEIKLHGDSALVNALKKTGKNDFLVINYEGTFTGSDMAQNDRYNFKADEHKAMLLKQSGVTHVSVANNHIYDFGRTGYENTIDALTRNKLIVIGETSKPKILRKGKYKCAVLAVSLTSNNDSLSISTIEQLKHSIKVFKSDKPLIPLILYIHWGLELQPGPEYWQRVLAGELAKSGVDAIIGHHPHVVQTIEFINEKPVFYSIGNYVADAFLPDTDNSYTVEVTVTDRIGDVKIRPVELVNYFPKPIDHKKQFSIIKNYLKYSVGICALQLTDGWMIKPIGSVNFQEKTSLWIFKERKITAAIKKLQSGTHLLTLYNQNDTSNTVSLYGQLSEIEIADINNDGTTDILLGISKKTYFDPTIKKRINIYSYQNHNLQPLWLGTKFIYNIESFNVKKTDNSNYLITFEIDKKGNRYQGMYEWDHFGFALSELKKSNTNEKY
jgi:hypothetical protein